MTSDLSALIARLEAAEAGSRELDAAIWSALLPVKAKVVSFWPLYSDERKTCVEFTLPPKRTATVTKNSGPYLHANPVTTSLDAALALAERVLPGCCPGVARNVHHKDWYSWVGSKDEEGCGDLGNGRGPSPALALCIAVLKAVQHATPIPHGYEAAGEVSPNLNPKAQGEVG